uniref:LOW QUALITY PROTEIN: paired box protein Pax-3-like n=1 Tax=Arvicanthis niloticus TaxID=61156 RepID=UPI0014864E33|nr:LOW QUALITY PROTEIN: paired box protein Pax-3-like [Arvicanthis niloticus]
MACVLPTSTEVPNIQPLPVLVSTIKPVPVLVSHRRLRDRFTGLHLQELERFFQRNHYLSAKDRIQVIKHGNITYPGHVERDEKEEKGVKAQLVLRAGEERNGEESDRSPAWAGSLSTKMGRSKRTEGMEEKGETTAGQMACVLPTSTEVPNIQPLPVLVSTIKPVPVLVSHRRLLDRFTGLHLQELERFFQRNHYLSAKDRKQLARWMGVTEAKLHRWFKKRREDFSRGQSQSGMSGGTPPETTPPLSVRGPGALVYYPGVTSPDTKGLSSIAVS